MDQLAYLKDLRDYVIELEGIIERFSEERTGIHIHTDDRYRLHEIVLELNDLCFDALGRNDYSKMVIDYYNDGIRGFSASPSYASVNEITGVVKALIKRFERNSNLLEEKKLSFIDDGLISILHPAISEHAYEQFKNGHYRDAVLNSIVAIFDFIRERTGLKEDGDDLIGKALSTKNPYLILSELETESGINDQIGFMKIYQGAYKGIRNPKAHSLSNDLNKYKAAQYLIFASLLARRIEEATLVKKVE